MEQEILKPWQEKTFIYMLLLMAGNPIIILYKSWIYTIYKVCFLIIVIICLWKYKDKWIRVKADKIKLSFIFMGMITFSAIINMDRQGISSLISYYIFILLGMLISELILKESFKVRLGQVMLVVCVISLLFFSIQILAPEFLNRLFWTSVVPNEDATYRSNLVYSAILETKYSKTGGSGSVVSFLKRNCGPFWEPGIFQCFISMGMVCLIENKNAEKFFHLKLLIFLLAFTSTVSVAGVASLAIIVIGYTIKNVKIFGAYISAALLGVTVIGIQMFDFILKRVWGKIPKLAYRIGLLELSFENVTKSALWGQSFRVFQSYNGYINLFLMFGTLFLGFWLWKLWQGSRSVAGPLFFGVIMVGLTSEPLAYSTIFWVFVFYSVDNKKTIERNWVS